MKTCSTDEIRSKLILREWKQRASATRKPVECAFGILKGRFSTLKTGIVLHHEDNAVFFILACVILHNMSIDSGDTGDDFLVLDDDSIVSTSSENTEAKTIREALLDYAVMYGREGAMK